MRTDRFDYHLPPDRIAQEPSAVRDHALLLVDRGAEHAPLHRRVSDLPGHLSAGDLVVVNDTRVRHARLALRKPTGGAVEALLLRPLGDGRWEALVGANRRVEPGVVLTSESDPALVVEVLDDLGEGRRLVRIEGLGSDPESRLEAVGALPLPPYISGPVADDRHYQTVYARHPGSAAAPTAGLHLTPGLLDRVVDAGATVTAIQLDVGLATFRPIATEHVTDHTMHTEYYRITPAVWDQVTRARRVVAIGTTTVRALESAAATGTLDGDSSLFITPGYDWQVVDMMMTNFHLPRSSLLVLVEAFVGPRWKDLYAEALQREYRFLSFEDAMLLERVMTLQFRRSAADGAARAGVITTARGDIPSPMFMPVGTRGAVRTIDSADLEALDAPIILGNTYHLMLRPGADVVADLGGLHGFMDWRRAILTDSGGYQVFSLEPKITDEGATFRSTYDGTTHLLTPESAVDIQVALGSDIQMVLDVCSPLPAPRSVLSDAVDQTARWAERARDRFLHHRGEGFVHGVALNQFGIVQGGVDPELRRDSARRTVDLGFEGYAVGGLSVGEERAVMMEALDAALDHLPADQPRYLMGVGDPIGIMESVARGIDMFDCVLPTRLARHGTALTDGGRLNVSRAEYLRSDERLADTGPAARYSLGYLRHLFKVGEASAARILTLHNLWWLLNLVRRARDAVEGGTFDALRGDIHQVWEDD